MGTCAPQLPPERRRGRGCARRARGGRGPRTGGGTACDPPVDLLPVPRLAPRPRHHRRAQRRRILQQRVRARETVGRVVVYRRRTRLRPCFSSSRTKVGAIAVCMTSPWSRATLLELRRSLPLALANVVGDPRTHAPWALTLATRERCALSTTRLGTIAGERGNYACAGSALLTGLPNRTRGRSAVRQRSEPEPPDASSSHAPGGKASSRGLRSRRERARGHRRRVGHLQ